MFNRTLQPGDTYRTPGLADLTVTTQDAGAVEVVYNGTPVGFVGQNGTPVEQLPLNQFASLAPPSAGSDSGKGVTAPPEAAIATTTTEPALTPEQAEAISRGIAAMEEAASQAERAERQTSGRATIAIDAGAAPKAAEQATAAEQPTEPAVALQEPARAPVAVPEPPAPAARPVAVVNVPPPVLPQSVIATPPPPVTEPTRRTLLGRLLPWRADREAAPAIDESPAATALILAPSITKEAADRAKAAADQAKVAREAARQKAATENQRRDGAFFNSTLGINSRY